MGQVRAFLKYTVVCWPGGNDESLATFNHHSLVHFAEFSVNRVCFSLSLSVGPAKSWRLVQDEPYLRP